MELVNFLHMPEILNKYEIINFVETGCFEGGSIQWAVDNGFGGNIWSCDFLEKYSDLCKAKHPLLSRNIYNLASRNFLSTILPHMQSRTLFWLDAHFPSYYSKHSTGTEKQEDISLEVPILDECSAIKSHKKDYYNDLIIVDDVDAIDDYGGIKREHRWHVSTDEWKTSDITDMFIDTHKLHIPDRTLMEPTYILVPLSWNIDIEMFKTTTI